MCGRTGSVARQLLGELARHDVTGTTVRVVDHDVKPGVYRNDPRRLLPMRAQTGLNSPIVGYHRTRNHDPPGHAMEEHDMGTGTHPAESPAGQALAVIHNADDRLYELPDSTAERISR